MRLQLRFAIAWAAMTPLVVGTPAILFLFSASATGDYLNDPCLDDPTSSDCDFHSQWLQDHEDIWSDFWAENYEHGLSFMSLESPSQEDPSIWPVDVWLDAGLNYFDPDITEQLIDMQIVAQGTFDLATEHYLGGAVDDFTDPDTGIIYTRETDVFSVSGVLTGSTTVTKPMAATIVRSIASDSLNNEQTVYHFEVVEQSNSLADATDVATELASGLTSESVGPLEPDPNDELPPDGIIACPYGGGDMDVECCWCYADRAACMNGCRGVFWQEFGDCLPSWETLATGVGCTACITVLKLLGASPDPISKAAIIASCSACLIGMVYTLIKCYTTARGAKIQCESECERDWLRCLRETGCPLPDPSFGS